MARLRREPSALCTLVIFGVFSYKHPETRQTRTPELVVGVETPSLLRLSLEPFPEQVYGVETTVEVRFVIGWVAKGMILRP